MSYIVHNATRVGLYFSHQSASQGMPIIFYFMTFIYPDESMDERRETLLNDNEINYHQAWLDGRPERRGGKGARLLIRFIYFINRFLFQKINFFVTFLNNSQNERIIINWKIMLMSERSTHKYMIEREKSFLYCYQEEEKGSPDEWMREWMNVLI